ncbi:tRNA (cytidine(34)-2'-O)-methyltransferase [Spongiibacter nanhainus]|uniref:tRNA (cytidine(34)-2'-O)-methyltransferase n=1 Tax=Spongiibacter nanhainus TaxID=2794344 RepID=A0A7T4R1S4_9GAMM|nr:tRNA (cytidine(34)-2'-O)-methyltransferase [Spongiibacter nanhainus]QQD18737.1 tRNA (cytidine(34)-2'-O)-methyltransferase [Spongiibacter nanhainus]
MFHIALHEPRIAPNTGNIIRLVANNGCHLHLIEPMGFDLEEKKLRRAGLDYADLARVSRYPDYPAFLAAMGSRRIFALTTKGTRSYTDVAYREDDVLLFGSETAGLPAEIREALGLDHCLRIPMMPGARSLNLSNAVALVSYEAWRQCDFAGL